MKYALLALLWGAVGCYVVWMAGAVRADRAGRKVAELRIEIADSTSQGQLVTSSEVRRWLRTAGIEAVGSDAGAVDLAAIEALVARNGFVGKVAAYLTRNGVLHIDIEQRKPLLRLLTEGENGYVTEQGFVFAAPQASSLYVPVVTGSYRPPFPLNHTGEVRACIDSERARIEAEIEQLEAEKLPLYRAQRADARAYKEVARKRISRWTALFARESDCETLRQALRDEKARALRAYRYRMRLHRQQLEQIEARQAAKRSQQKKLEKNYEDFMKLLTFVKLIEKDDFWSAEVVQIIVRTAPSGSIEVELIPRSGRHLIRFGRLERMPEKLDKLLRFYRKGLSQIGWNTYRVLDIRYTDQVVCR